MPSTPDCKPWCEEHQTIGENSCTRLICLYRTADGPAEDNPGSEPGKVDPQMAGFREQFQAFAGFPDQVDTVFLDISQDLEEDEGTAPGFVDSLT